MEEYADTAFGAKAMPDRSATAARCSCSPTSSTSSARAGSRKRSWPVWQRAAEEHLALRVADPEPLASSARSFVLQGGTQYNLAAVKAQVDFIESRFKGKERRAEIIVHEHCGESGAIGAALEARPPVGQRPRDARFIGLDAVRRHQYKTTRNEVDALLLLQEQVPAHVHRRQDRASCSADVQAAGRRPKVPLEAGEQRLIIATCEKGTVEDIDEMRGIKGDLDEVKKANPNFVEIAAKEVFRVPDVPLVADPAAASSRSPPRRRSAPR